MVRDVRNVVFRAFPSMGPGSPLRCGRDDSLLEFAGGRGYVARFTATTALSPPKAKELESAASTTRGRDWFGT
jgi:hypothetical protein